MIQVKKVNFEHTPSDLCCLAFTVKILGCAVEGSVEDYQQNILNRWARLAGVTLREPYFEKDSSGCLHMHGIIYVRKGFYKKRLQTPGYYIHVKDCYDIDQWLEYCQKTAPLDPDAAMLLHAREALDNRYNWFLD